jgi:hypothetical protein
MDDNHHLLLVKPGMVSRKTIITPEGNDEEELVAAGDAYATVKGQRHAEGLTFLRRGRRDFSMLYDYRPIPWVESPALLLLEYPGFFTAALHCKGAGGLVPLVVDRRITWVRECSRAETADVSIAIFRIDILHAYPSREEEAIRPDL